MSEHQSGMGYVSVNRTTAIFGFHVDKKLRYRLGDRRFRLGRSGIRTLNLLREVYYSCTLSRCKNWAIGVRPQIRQIRQLNSRAVLSLVIQQTDDPTLRVLAIWLRGHCGGLIGTAVLADFVDDPDFATRKEVARTLKRMSGWKQLREMAENDPSERIRRMATATPATPYRTRLSRFSKDEYHQITPKKHPLVVASRLELGRSKPFKSPRFIRMVLERIHRIVARQTR